MRFAEFEHVARAAWERIPPRYKEGIDGLILDRAARQHPEDADVYTLGECVTEEYPSQYGGPETIRSAVVLYYGSFRTIARDDAEFDWHGEIHETLMHELQHHLESLATEDGLEDFDYAMDENFKRVRGDAFDPLFYRAGVKDEAVRAVRAVRGVRGVRAVDTAVFHVDRDIFVEVVTRGGGAGTLELAWEGTVYRAELPASDADVTYLYAEDEPRTDGDFCIVRVVRRGALATLRSALGGRLTVEEAPLRVERIS